MDNKLNALPLEQTPLEVFVENFFNGLKEYGISSAKLFLYVQSLETFNVTTHVRNLTDEASGTFYHSQFLHVESQIPQISMLVFIKGSSENVKALLQKETAITPGFNFSTGYRTS